MEQDETVKVYRSRKEEHAQNEVEQLKLEARMKLKQGLSFLRKKSDAVGLTDKVQFAKQAVRKKTEALKLSEKME